VKPTRSRLAALEAAARAKRERNRPRGVIDMTTGERRKFLASLCFEGRHGREPTPAELSAYVGTPEHDADDRLAQARANAFVKALPGAPSSSAPAFFASDKGQAAIAVELARLEAREAAGKGLWDDDDEPEVKTP
jgi:hypothetical protein